MVQHAISYYKVFNYAVTNVSLLISVGIHDFNEKTQVSKIYDAMILFLLNYMCKGNGWKFIHHGVYLSLYLGGWNGIMCVYSICFLVYTYFFL